MAFISIEVCRPTDNKGKLVEVPNDKPVNRILAVLVEKLGLPIYDRNEQRMSYKFYHPATKKQLLDEQTLDQAGVKNGDILRLQVEIVAGANKAVKNDCQIAGINSEQDDRFSRFKLISWWDQEKLQKAKVLVVGAGALGNEILKNLALLGIGNIFIADMDTIEDSNLSRSILFRESDNGLSKAEVAAKALKNIYPEVNVGWFHGNIVYDLGLGVYKWADLVIAGLDNREARLFINQCCWKTNTPWIDGAIEQLDGIARVFIPPHGACYECTMSKTDYEILKARKSCNLLTRGEMLAGRVPTTPTSASVIAGIQCQEAVKLLHGLEVLESKGYIFNGLTHDSYVVNYQRKENCFSHETYDIIRSLGMSVAKTKVGYLLEEIRRELGNEAILEFNNNILYSLVCEKCGNSELILKSLGKITEKEGLCHSCGDMRSPNTLHSISGNEDFLNRTFTDIGVPPFDIIVGREGMNQVFLEFDKDGPSVLGPLYVKN